MINFDWKVSPTKTLEKLYYHLPFHGFSTSFQVGENFVEAYKGDGNIQN